MSLDPASAPPRPDLTFLRHRTRRAPANAALSDFIAGHATHAPQHSVETPTPPPVSGSLDLDEPPSPPSAAAAPQGTPAAPARTTTDALPTHEDHRLVAGAHHVLSVREPTVTLSRVQSGIGQLQVEAVCSRSVGDLRLGAAYQLADGATSTVQYAGGNRFAPSSRRPVIVAGRDEYEHLRVDLRQVTSLDRMTVYAFSESRTELTWGGTLVVTTFGGARVDLPLETLHPGRIAVLLSIFNLHGEFVVRAEMETIAGDVREAARAYGYERITWRDERSPAD